MSRHNSARALRQQPAQSRAAGFTLVELVIVIVMIGIIIVPMYTFFNTSFSQYISLQKEGSGLSDLTTQSQRIANVMRGVTGINSVTADSIDCYAYFSPSDDYVSHIRYYKDAANTQLLADVTRMTSNPPIGTEIPSTLHTYTIINNFFQGTGINTFTYLDDSGAALTLPISDLKTIKSIKVTLAVPDGNLSKNSSQTIFVQVSLRNRKSNL